MRILRPYRRAVGLASATLAVALIVASCSTDGVMALRPDVDVGVQTAGVPMAPMPAPPLAAPEEEAVMSVPVEEPAMDPPSVMSAPAEAPEADINPLVKEQEEQFSGVEPRAKTTMVAYPRVENPAAAPQRQMSVPEEEVDCRRELKKLKVTYRDLPRIGSGGTCGIDFPVEVSAIGSVKMKPAATLSCAMAATFARWTRNELVPSARWRYLSGVKTIHQGSSYSCRNIRGSGRASEHARGNALDIMSIELTSGKNIDVRKPGIFAFRKRGFLNTVRADGCQYFNTVLGPGYNADHADHFHFDIMKRRNGHVACK